MCCSYKSSKISIESWTDIKKVRGVIQFNQEEWLKSYIKINSKLTRDAKKMILRKTSSN